jgi:dihydroflavonol-4-reductase
MRVLVTGGSGFVGGSIVRTLLQQGNQVRVFARHNNWTDHLTALGIEIAYGDILDLSSIKEALKDCTMLYHAAALYDLWGLEEQTLMQTEREGTRNALDAALLGNVAKVIYTSTAVIIGEEMGVIGTESTKHRGYFLKKYERAKFEAEQIAVSYLNKGLPLIIVNLAGVYRPGDLKPSGRAIIDLINGRMPGLFKGTNSLVYLDDVGMGHVLAAMSRVPAAMIISGSFLIMCHSRRKMKRGSSYINAYAERII